ncbi:MAG TPA: hypothetical protein VK157_17545 [Phycisphaerales bacterium]|nr:hypothetical protein [Phycisphaerales bacterium]
MACAVFGLLMVIVIAILAVLFTMSDRSKWQRLGMRCERCGYDLASLITERQRTHPDEVRCTCPECGTGWVPEHIREPSAASKIHAPRKRIALVLVLVWIVIGVIGISLFVAIYSSNGFGPRTNPLLNAIASKSSGLAGVLVIAGPLVWIASLLLVIRAATKRPGDGERS